MKILQMLADGDPGGGTEIVLSLCGELIKHGHDVHLATQEGSYASSTAQGLNVKVVPVDFFKSVLSHALKKRIQEICGSIKPDLIHVHGSRAAFHVSRCDINIPSVYTVHGYHFIKRNFIRRQLGKISEMRNTKRFDCITFVCEYDMMNSQRLGITKNTSAKEVVYNGIDISSLPSKKESSESGKTIVFLGRLCYPKDPMLFLEVVKLLVDWGYCAKIIGGGELEEEVKKKIKRLKLENCVTMMGTLPHEKAMEVLVEAHCMIMTSRWEGFPVSVLEAMAMGVPVIAPDVNGIPEIIVHKKNGLLVESRKPADFVDQVKYIADFQNYSEISVNARQTVRDNFSTEKMYKKYAAIYERVK